MENENASGKNLSPKENLALQILEFTQEQIIMRMPYMSRAVLKMPAVFTAEKDEAKKYQSMYADPDTMGTDGMSVYCNAEGIIRWFENAPRMLPRRYLHMVLHCLFSHPFQYTSLKEDYWDLAADMAVEHVIMNLGMKELASDRDPEKKKVLREIETETGKITAEKIYHLLISDENRAYDMLKLKDLFVADTHDFWIDRELTVSDMIVSRQCSLMELEDKDPAGIFGYPDTMKLRSCMTLFAEVSGEDSVFRRVLKAFFGGVRDERTIWILGRYKDE